LGEEILVARPASQVAGVWSRPSLTTIKYKVNRGQEFVIGEYTPENPFDALIVGYYESGRLL
jgi:hypothetical protein